MSDLQINLAGIEHAFYESGRICADCGKDFDADPPPPLDENEEIENEEPDVPLLLWREEGRLMLTLCWQCAEKRMKPDPGANWISCFPE